MAGYIKTKGRFFFYKNLYESHLDLSNKKRYLKKYRDAIFTKRETNME